MDQISEEREQEQRAIARRFKEAVEEMVALYNQGEKIGLVMRFNIIPNDGKFGKKMWKADVIAVETRPVDLLAL